MELKSYQLFINGQPFQNRGLDIACNPFSGRVVGEVVLISDSLLTQVAHDPEEETLTLFSKNPSPQLAL